MIPKIIHYCWFGRGKKSKLIEKCIRSWKKYCPDYEIIEWNEDNFDIESNRYVKEAYENRKWAFVSDYVRLYALCSMGGVYVDTDVELLKNIDNFLANEAFTGFESEENMVTGIMGCIKGHKMFSYLLSYYDDAKFVLDDGSLNTKTNVQTINEMFMKKGFVKNGEYQKIEGMAIYPRDYFCPYEDSTGIMNKTENTYAIHWFNKSWVDKSAKIRSKITRPFHRIFGVDCFEKFKNS